MIPVNQPVIGETEKAYVMDCLETGWISSAGKYVKEFEEKFAKYCDCKYAVTASNGTTAIHLALKSLDISVGDEVLVPSFTMAGSVYPIVQCGAKPVFVDSEMDTYNLDVDDLRKKITPAAKAIMVVHLYGHPADMDPIMDLARQHNLYVIEDAAEAHGALYKERKVGCIGDIGCFSFYANKIVTTGEGGMLVSNNEKLINLARRLKDLSHMDKRFMHDLPEAYNYRMTNIQAAIGLGQLERIDDIIKDKIDNANLYNDLLGDLGGLALPIKKDWAKHVYWMYAVMLTSEAPISRDQLMMGLKNMGVDTRTFFYPLNNQPAFAGFEQKGTCPNAEILGLNGLYLPSGQALTKAQIHCVSKALHDVWRVNV